MQFIAFDIETTGFLPKVDQIVEIAAVRFVNGKPESSFSTLVNPNIPIPAGASKVNGITDEMVAGKPSVESAIQGFSDFCGKDILVAHNAPFDVEFLKADILKFELPAPKGAVLDSCAMARRTIQGSPNYKLETLVKFLQIPNSDAFHRAEADARMCGLLLFSILSRIYRPGEPIVIENLINLSGTLNLKFPQVVKTHKQLDLLAGI